MPTASSHPAEHDDTWDVIVVGAGPPGENAADYAIRGSHRRAVLVEKELLGGECSYWACIPSKAMLRPAELIAAARHMPGVAQLVGDRPLDVGAVLDRRDRFVGRHDDSGQVAWAQGRGIDVVRGRGHLIGDRTMEVTSAGGAVRTLRARHAVVLATGTRATIPPVPGLSEARPWTSRDVTNLHEVPDRVVVIGGGVVACESVTWLHALGCSSISIVEPAPRLMGRTEAFVGELLAEQFRKAGIALHLATGVAGVARRAVGDAGEGLLHGGEVTVTLADGSTIVADEVVVAAGRTPNSDDLGLDTVGVSTDKAGFVEVDEHLTVPGTDWLYAVGDLTGRALLTHMGKYQARIAGDVIGARAEGRPLDGDRYRDVADPRAVPQVTFTDPEVGSVGYSADEAAARGIDVEVVDYEIGKVSGASLFREDYVGRARFVIDRDTDTLVGATFVGDGVAELVHSATVAVVGRVPVAVLWHAVPSFPTISEIWLRLLETLRDRREGRAGR